MFFEANALPTKKYNLSLESLNWDASFEAMRFKKEELVRDFMIFAFFFCLRLQKSLRKNGKIDRRIEHTVIYKWYLKWLNVRMADWL